MAEDSLLTWQVGLQLHERFHDCPCDYDAFESIQENTAESWYLRKLKTVALMGGGEGAQ